MEQVKKNNIWSSTQRTLFYPSHDAVAASGWPKSSWDRCIQLPSLQGGVKTRNSFNNRPFNKLCDVFRDANSWNRAAVDFGRSCSIFGLEILIVLNFKVNSDSYYLTLVIRFITSKLLLFKWKELLLKTIYYSISGSLRIELIRLNSTTK